MRYENSYEWLNFLVTFSLIFIGIFLLFHWLQISSGVDISRRIAISGNETVENRIIKKTDIKGKFEKFNGVPSTFKGSWTGFRGNLKDNVNRETVSLLDTVDQKKLPINWSVDLGEGYAGAAIANGRVYLLDYDKENESDSLRCFSVSDGKEIWRRSYRIKIKRNHGISRTVPAVNDKFCLTVGPKCHVMCVNSQNGDFLWGIDLKADYGTKIPLWYTGQCPLIDGNLAIIAPAGEKLIIGVDCVSGKVVFSTPNPDKFKMSHSSIIPMTFHGKKMYVYCPIGGIVGISAEDKDRGTVLFKTTEWKHSVISPSPVKVGDDRILVSAGYGAGSMMFRIIYKDNVFSIKKLFAIDKSDFACEQHTPIYYKGHLFTVLPADAGEMNKELVCMKPDGTQVWSSGKDNRFGLGPFLIADGKIFVLNDNGVLTVVQASLESYSKIWQARVLNGREAWAPIAISGGLMILRDLKRMICLDLRKDVN
ncbi:PQQ-binding-like beta-propeller repeat protein [bacterium]|nr:PQQ-binding-like beta-propeller repeat protein [bacterium]